MPLKQNVYVRIDLARIRSNVIDIARRVGVPVWAVVKADAYGLGALSVVRAVSDLVAGFCTFSLDEAVEIRTRAQTDKPVSTLGPPEPGVLGEAYRQFGVRPAISTFSQAVDLRVADPLLCVDTGMQRFSCPPEMVEHTLAAGRCREAFTHAASVQQAERLNEMLGARGLVLHAAGSALLDESAARLDLVRPGLAMYAGAVRVTAQLVEVHRSRGPAGYTGFVTPRHGVILAGYAHGLRPGPCVIRGQRRRVIEVGMQTAFVTLGEESHVGDEIVLLGDGLTGQEIAADWRSTPHEVLIRLAGLGVRSYDEGS